MRSIRLKTTLGEDGENYREKKSRKPQSAKHTEKGQMEEEVKIVEAMMNLTDENCVSRGDKITTQN